VRNTPTVEEQKESPHDLQPRNKPAIRNTRRIGHTFRPLQSEFFSFFACASRFFRVHGLIGLRYFSALRPPILTLY
jgi:hypothetical protein